MTDYATTAELGAYLRITDDVDDVTLALAIAASSRAIDVASNREFGLTATPELRYYTANYDRRSSRYIVQIDDLMTADDLVVTKDGVAVTDYTLAPRNAPAKGQPYTELWVSSAGEVEVTALWGWTEVPDAVKSACLMQASRLFARRDSPFGVAGSLDMGSEMRLLAKIDPDVEVTLRAFRRWWGAA
ncbi:hypothetical protein [Pseudonocardia abyssalis]|uniref:Phage gp6-like head-tail connector protein n=1 Tax=Pseudonocardia abyssalis TaxID=2792008 RepID=A0ABS6UXZ4_9PSEU|nr:hypothetical protein [Pseudonocardia abyssalis]MBW0117024.1 phage gp6-like head-tail connector protein [Pseudonocardia abyssalis]MBW0136856.1 phage gp6-like head-tail connector protein [Pseudonocardia abyssalis]